MKPELSLARRSGGALLLGLVLVCVIVTPRAALARPAAPPGAGPSMSAASLDGDTLNLSGTLQAPNGSCGLNKGSFAGCVAQFNLQCPQGTLVGPLLFWSDEPAGPVQIQNSIDLNLVHVQPGTACMAYLTASYYAGQPTAQSPTGIPVTWPGVQLAVAGVALTHGPSGAYLLYKLRGASEFNAARATIVIRQARGQHGVVGRLSHRPEPGTNALRLPPRIGARLRAGHRYRISISARDKFNRTARRDVIAAA